MLTLFLLVLFVVTAIFYFVVYGIYVAMSNGEAFGGHGLWYAVGFPLFVITAVTCGVARLKSQTHQWYLDFGKKYPMDEKVKI